MIVSNVIQVSTESSGSPRLLQKGIFVLQQSKPQYDMVDSRKMDLDNYERVWQQKVFTPCIDELQKEVRYFQ